jgi:hypothetical protein
VRPVAHLGTLANSIGIVKPDSLARAHLARQLTPDMLLDEILPEFHVRASYGTQVRASPERVYACVGTADFNHWGLMRTLLALRAVPGLLVAPRETWRHVRERGRRRVQLADVLASGFTLLGERPGEELVLGTIGRFWRARGEVRAVSRESFREIGIAGTAKAAWNFAVRPGADGRTVLTTETRVLCADQAARRLFRTYWTVVGPFSGLIRREMLAAVRDTAEANPPTGGA